MLVVWLEQVFINALVSFSCNSVCMCVGVHSMCKSACVHTHLSECLWYLCWSTPPPLGFCKALCSSCWVGYTPPGTGRHLQTSLHHTHTSHSHSSRGLKETTQTTCCLSVPKSMPLPSASKLLYKQETHKCY